MNLISVSSSTRTRTLCKLAHHLTATVLIRPVVAICAAVLLALVFFTIGAPRVLADQPNCGILQDCSFDGFYGNGTGAGSGPWKIAKISGNPSISLHPVEGWPSGPSVWFQSTNSPFDATIYQKVPATPGLAYHFNLPFAVVNLGGKGWNPSNQVNRRLGIDPYGGTDPNSSNIQWSPDYLGKGKVLEQIDWDAYAQSSTITAFIRVTNPYTDIHVDVFVDSPSLVVNTGLPPMSVAAPTATNPPPTNPPPTKPPATARPTAVPTEVAVEPTATDVPTATAVASATDAPTDVVEASDTPTRPPTRVRRSTPVPVPTVQANTSTNFLVLGLFSLVGLGGVAIAAILFGAAFVYWRRARN